MAETGDGDPAAPHRHVHDHHGLRGRGRSVAGRTQQRVRAAASATVDLATETDPAANVTNYAYDAEGQLLTVTLQNYTGNPAQPTSPAPLVTESRAYDPAGRLDSETDPLSNATSYTYDQLGDVATQTD